MESDHTATLPMNFSPFHCSMTMFTHRKIQIWTTRLENTEKTTVFPFGGRKPEG